MIRRPTSFALAVLLLAFVSVAAAGDDDTRYGEGLAGARSVSILELLAEPERFVGQTIRVEGRIGDVCPRMGCWIDIVDDGARQIRFKVKDGVIVFPTEIKGKRVVAEGIFTKIEMTEDEALSWARHLAEERGESFDPDTAEIERSFYRIDGKGAVVR